MGPETNPISGPTVQTVIAVPRFSMGMRSATKPPPTVTGTELATPMKNREIINIGMFTLVAQTIAEIIKRTFAICVMGSLPVTSVIGVRHSGPRAEPIT